jgi:hypothetical protein
MINTELKQKIVDKIDLLEDDQLETVYELLLHFLYNKNDKDTVIKLTDEQRQIIKLGEEDSRAGRYISQDELDNQDLAWLNEP